MDIYIRRTLEVNDVPFMELKVGDNTVRDIMLLTKLTA
jgi:hypothetical protein